MLITLILLSILSFGTGFAVHKHLHLRQFFKHPEPSELTRPSMF